MPEYLYLDIETIPTQDTATIAALAEAVKPPASMSKPETIAKWEVEQKPTAVKEAIHKAGLDGGLGHVCCIGWAFGDAEPQAMIAETVAEERDLMVRVFGGLGALQRDRRHLNQTVIVGHNVVDFDIRFLWQRAIVLGVRLPRWFPRDPKPWGGEVQDTMTMWAGARNMISMDRLCGYLGLSGKSSISGADIADRWLAKDFANIAQYCADDVARTRAMHRKMLVVFDEVA